MKLYLLPTFILQCILPNWQIRNPSCIRLPSSVWWSDPPAVDSRP